MPSRIGPDSSPRGFGGWIFGGCSNGSCARQPATSSAGELRRSRPTSMPMFVDESPIEQRQSRVVHGLRHQSAEVSDLLDDLRPFTPADRVRGLYSPILLCDGNQHALLKLVNSLRQPGPPFLRGFPQCIGHFYGQRHLLAPPFYVCLVVVCTGLNVLVFHVHDRAVPVSPRIEIRLHQLSKGLCSSDHRTDQIIGLFHNRSSSTEFVLVGGRLLLPVLQRCLDIVGH